MLKGWECIVLVVLGVGDVGWLGFGFDENLGDVERERVQKGCFEAMFHIPQQRSVIIVSISCRRRVLQYAFFSVLRMAHCLRRLMGA
jgi:hypothetical protein